MIEAKDLRIGNLVYHQEEKILNVCSIKHKTITAFNSERHFRHCRYEFIYPISLTPEALEKAGFAKDDKYLSIKFFDLDSCRIEFFKKDDVLISIIIGHYLIENSLCLYVHQLQNLYYCLTGKELQIKL